MHYTNGAFSRANGEYSRIEKVANSLKITESEAIGVATRSSSNIEGIKPVSTKAQLTLWRQNEDSAYRYVYEVEVIFADATKSKICMVDAETGEVLLRVDVVCNVNVGCTGATVYSGNRNFTGDTFAGGVRLRQVRNGVNIATLNNQNSANVNTVDFANATTTWTSAGANQGALDVHFGVEMFLDYFRNIYQRNSIDDAGHQITCLLNRWTLDGGGSPVPMDNAFFDPNDTRFSFGNGNTIFSSVTSLDVVAHELAHGFAHFEVGFNSTGEARSLNEGFSDIWAATVENWSAIPGKQTWMVGEEIMANGFSCLRSLRNPATEGFRAGFFTEGNYPNTRLGPNWRADNSPPHINATVLGHWYFLLSEGGAGTNGIGNPFNVAGLGIQTAAQIAYNTELALTPSADFMSVRTASIAYATQEWGANSCQVKTVTDAWFAVGVGPAYSGTLGMSVAGPSLVCSSNTTFSLQNRPPGTTVTWTRSSNLTQVSGQGTNSYVVIAGSSRGNGWVRATINGPCGQVVLPQKTVWVGPPNNPTNVYVPGYYGVNPITLVKESLYTFQTSTVAGASRYNWTLPSGFSFMSGQGTTGSSVKVWTPNTSGTFNLRSSPANGCGSSGYATLSINLPGSGGGGGPGPHTLSQPALFCAYSS